MSGTEYWANPFSRSMRNSSTCGARWVRLVIDGFPPTCRFGIRISIENRRYHAGNWITADHRERLVGAGLEGSFRTPMIANLSDDRVRVRHRLETSNPSWACPGWYA